MEVGTPAGAVAPVVMVCAAVAVRRGKSRMGWSDGLDECVVRE